MTHVHWSCLKSWFLVNLLDGSIHQSRWTVTGDGEIWLLAAASCISSSVAPIQLDNLISGVGLMEICIYIYTYYVLLCTVLYIDDVGINLWDKDILEPLTPVSPGSERERPSHHQPRPASKSQCLWSSHGQVQLGAGTMACGSTSLRTRNNICINMCVCVRARIRLNE
jgi:hypothetical protein